MIKKLNLFFILILIIHFCLAHSLLLDTPLVWPDEVIYGDTANNLMLGNGRGTELWKGFIDGIENHAYSLPPFFLYSSAIWYKLFGFTIINQRLFSVFLGALVLISFYAASKKAANSNKPISKLIPLAISFLLSVDFIFLNASRISRPEILVLLLVIVAIFFYFKSFTEKKIFRENLALFLSGLFLGLSVITHLLATGFALATTLALMYSKGKRLFHNKMYLFFLAGVVTPILIWQAWLFPYHQYFFDQLHLVQLSRQHTTLWYIGVSESDSLIKINFIIYFVISIAFILFTLKNREKYTHVLLSLLIVAAWVFTTLGTLFWYTVYGVTLAYFALASLMHTAFNLKSNNSISRMSKLSLISICLILVCTNIATYSSLYFAYGGKHNYEAFSSQIIDAIPPGKTVYLSSLPDAYYAFPAGRNTLLEFPALFAGKDNFLRTIIEADYIILNGSYIPDPNAFGYLDNYISKNLDSANELKSPYSVVILKMKDRAQRTIN